MSHYTLDVRGLLCPMPVIRTQNRVKELQAGDTLEIFCTDPGANSDIPAWCRVTGHRYIDTREQGNDIIICIEVGKVD